MKTTNASRLMLEIRAIHPPQCCYGGKIDHQPPAVAEPVAQSAPAIALANAIKYRPYQREAAREFSHGDTRFWALLWERQAGKSTVFADMALYEMMQHTQRTIIYGSASLLLAQEITLKTGTRTHNSAQDVVAGDAKLLRDFAAVAEKSVGKKLQFKTVNAETDKPLEKLSEADFTELFAQQKLEFRVYHSPTSYSRTKVIAPNIATARSWSGTVLLDEVAFIPDLRELINALLPVISTTNLYKLVLSTTPPEFNDTHYSFELLAPRAGEEFKPSAKGNWYNSENGIRVHRVDAFDTSLAGKKIYDLKTGEVISPEEAFRRAPNKEGHRVAHWLWWTLGGSAACDALRLKVAQERGAAAGPNGAPCQNFQIDSDAEMARALNWLANHIDHQARVGVGFDVATTTKGASNPSVVSVLEEHGPEWIVRARFVWRTREPDVANERLDGVIDCISSRPGGRAVALAQDATNEKYYAEDNRKRLRHKLPVILVVASERVPFAGLQKPVNFKEWLGDTLVAKLDDNNLTLPGDTYTHADYRLVLKDRGKFVCEPNDQGMHGDTFDADKLAGYALRGGTGRTVVPALRTAVAGFATGGAPNGTGFLRNESTLPPGWLLRKAGNSL